MDIDFSSRSATSITLTMSDPILVLPYPGDVSFEVQVAFRPDFQFCVCPVISIALATSYVVSGLNQRTNYFVRARRRNADGTSERWSNVILVRTDAGTARVTSPDTVMVQPSIIVIPETVQRWLCDNVNDGYAIENLGRDGPESWEGTGTALKFIVDMGYAPIDIIALLNTNFPESATITISAGNVFADVDTGTYAFSTGALPFRASINLEGRRGYHSLTKLSSALSYRWWRIDIAAGVTLPVGHIEHVIFGLNRATKNMSSDKTETGITLTTVDRLRDGTPNRVDGLPMRRVEFDISYLSEQQFETQLSDLIYRDNLPVLAVPNSKGNSFFHDRILFGDLVSSQIVNHASPRFSRSFSINSLI